MKWTKHKIEDVDKFAAEYIKIIRKGEANLEHMYCVFLFNDNPIVQMLSIFDFIDAYNARQITKDAIIKIYSYQPFNKS